jgi:hypothetical protein
MGLIVAGVIVINVFFENYQPLGRIAEHSNPMLQSAPFGQSMALQ